MADDEKPKVREHVPRLLHKNATGGYTHSPSIAARAEPEALSREDLERYATLAYRQDQQAVVARTLHAAPDREALSPDNRAREVDRRARRLKVDTRKEMWCVRQMLSQDRIDSALKKLRDVEARLDRVEQGV